MTHIAVARGMNPKFITGSTVERNDAGGSVTPGSLRSNGRMRYANKPPFVADIGANPIAVHQNLTRNPLGLAHKKHM